MRLWLAVMVMVDLGAWMMGEGSGLGDEAMDYYLYHQLCIIHGEVSLSSDFLILIPM